jgi:hypothetical protein
MIFGAPRPHEICARDQQSLKELDFTADNPLATAINQSKNSSQIGVRLIGRN